MKRADVLRRLLTVWQPIALHKLPHITSEGPRHRSVAAATRPSEDDPSSLPLTSRTEIVNALKELRLNYFVTPHTRRIRSQCPECHEEDAVDISPFGDSVDCIHCSANWSHFDLYEKRVRIAEQEKRQGESTASLPENGTSSGTPRRALSQLPDMDDLDSDLYDSVGYLDLINTQKEAERAKLEARLEHIRRLRAGADSLTPRDVAESSCPVDQLLAFHPDPDIKYFWEDSRDIVDVTDVEDRLEIRRLQRGLGIERVSAESLSRYNTRVSMSTYRQPAILYPRYRGPTCRSRPPFGLKVISLIEPNSVTLYKENYPMDESRFSGIFGFHMVTPADTKVVLTTNERDALAVYEVAGMLALALPKGEKLDDQVLPFLEEFAVIYLWFPHKQMDNARDYATVLNPSRCRLITHKARPIELLRKNRATEIVDGIETSVAMFEKRFRSMIDMRDGLREELLHDDTRLRGIAQWKRFDMLNRYLVGFRKGELTVLTGQTGVGKTTFLCEYALDLFTQGVRTLFCSFEMKEERILKWMLVQYAGIPVHQVQNSSLVDAWLDRFERAKGTLTIMKSDEFRDQKLSEIVEAIRATIASNGIHHVVIDNLQFLVGHSLLNDDSVSGIDRMNAQDRLVGHLRRLATDYDVHITLVVHPRKTDSDVELDVHHFGGTARVTQEADNVLVIQRKRDETTRRPRKFLYIKKNRGAGLLLEGDFLEMNFHPATYSHSLVPLDK